ncbi:MAG: GNAT family N-acetyltransferase [Candidatus Aminicenantes bacterium]|nr:GNAT family N-acetyltransferase [Candidatus Aminicenantes bacterium]
MTVRFSFLEKRQFPLVHKTFLEAFSDYQVDMSYMTEEVMFKRAVKNAVAFESSVGVYDGDRMVGFTLIGIDNWKNFLSAFDIGTGIIKEYRGMGIARQMFDFSLSKLKKQAVEKFILEVIQTNEPAVKAYRNTGFNITREWDCYELDVKKANLQENADFSINIQLMGKDVLSLFQDFLDWEPSWENSFSAIMRIPDDVILCGALSEGECVGLLAYCPFLNWIMTLAVKKDFRRRGVASQLLTHLPKYLPPENTKMNLLNVDHSDSGMREFLDKNGFELCGRQYEMEMIL